MVFRYGVAILIFTVFNAFGLAQTVAPAAPTPGDSTKHGKLTHMQRDSVQNAKIDSMYLHDSSLTLQQNYPNPFQTTTTFIFQVNDVTLVGTQVTLEIFDLSGTKLATLYDAPADNSVHYLSFNGGGLTRGAYEYRLICGEHQKVQLMNYFP